jgi:hypothetical protein
VPVTDYDTWVVCRHHFADSGKSAVITVNSSFATRIGFARFPYYVWVVIEAATHTIDVSGRISPHESHHLLDLSNTIRAALDGADQHIVAIVHGAGARSLALYARDGGRVTERLNALKHDNVWDRRWNFRVQSDPQGMLSAEWRHIADTSNAHHLTIYIPHGPSGTTVDHHHYLF